MTNTPSRFTRFIQHYGSILWDNIKGFFITIGLMAGVMTPLLGFFYLITLGLMKMHWVNPVAFFEKGTGHPVFGFSMLLMWVVLIALAAICAIVKSIRQIIRTWQTI